MVSRNTTLPAIGVGCYHFHSAFHNFSVELSFVHVISIPLLGFFSKRPLVGLLFRKFFSVESDGSVIDDDPTLIPLQDLTGGFNIDGN